LNHRKFHFAASAAAVVICGLLCAPAQAQVKIGFTGPLSGPAGAIGQDQYDGFMLAVERLQGKLGGQTATILKEDDQLKPEVGLQAARKLIEKDKVDAIVGLGYTNVFMAMVPVITQSGVVAIGTTAGPQAVAGAGCKANIFAMTGQNDGPSEAMGKFAQQKRYAKTYLMAPNYQAGKEMLAAFKRHYEGKVVDEVYPPLNQTDFSSEIAQIQAANPDALFMFMPGGLGINLIKQMKQAGVLGKFPVMSVFTVATTLPALKQQAEGVMAGAMWDAAFDNKESSEFEQAFQAKYKRVASLYAAVGYDTANLLHVAISKAGSKVSDKAAFAAAVKAAGSEFKSVRGNFRFNNNNMPIQDYHVFQVVKSGADVGMAYVSTPVKAHSDAYHAQCALK
jgi:branched-chain amino acid transport system substrate-binding protein